MEVSNEKEIKFNMTKKQFDCVCQNLPFVFIQNFYFHIDENIVVRARRKIDNNGERFTYNRLRQALKQDLNNCPNLLGVIITEGVPIKSTYQLTLKKNIKSFPNIIESLNQTESSFNQVESSLNQTESSFNKTQSSFNQTQSWLNQTESSFNQTVGSFNQVESSLNQTESSFNQTVGSFNQVESSLNQSESSFDEFTSLNSGGVFIRECEERTIEIDEDMLESFLQFGISCDKQLEYFGCVIGSMCFLGVSTTQRHYASKFGFLLEYDKYTLFGSDYYQVECEMIEGKSADELNSVADYLSSLEYERAEKSKSQEFLVELKKQENKLFSCVMFDFDGTLADSIKGVYECFKKTFEHFGLDVEKIDIRSCVGPPLDLTFTKYIGAEFVQQALDFYRNTYRNINGDDMIALFDGIQSLLLQLKRRNIRAVVATNKYQRTAIKLLDRFNVLDLFAYVGGVDYEKGILNKQHVIMDILSHLNLDSKQVVLVGDTIYDAQGAFLCGVDTIAVGYGYGKICDILVYPLKAIALTPADVLKYLSTV